MSGIAALPPGALRALFMSLLRRELATTAAAQRIIVIIAISVTAGVLAGSVGPLRPGGRPGLADMLVGSYEQLAGFCIGLLAGSRFVASLHADQRAGWLTQLCAAGMRREWLVLLLAAATLAAAWLDYLGALAAFGATHAAAAGAPPVARLLNTVPGALLWMAAAMALAVLLAILLNDRTRARFALHTLLVAPYVLGLLPLMVGDERPPTAVMRVAVRVVPFWSAPPSLAYASYLLLYISVALALALRLAPHRVERSV
jgi:hypothetical protein